QMRAELVEETPVQIGRRAVRFVGGLVAREEEVVMRRGQLAAMQAFEANPGVGDLAAFGADLLALGLGERREEVVEATVAGVAPVELDAAPGHRAGAPQ